MAIDDQQVIEFAQRIYQRFTKDNILTASASAIACFIAQEYHFGDYDPQRGLSFTALDLIRLNASIEKSTGCNPAFLPAKAADKSRIENSKDNFSTKKHTSAATQGFVLVNCLATLKINQQSQRLPAINSLGIYINASDVLSIEHQQIVLVENLAVMAALAQLKLPADVCDPLFVYRGDIKPEQNTSSAYQFFRQWSGSHQLICFSDFDPAGIVISNGSSALDCLIPSTSSWDYIFTVELKDVEENWWKKNPKKAVQTLCNKQLISPVLVAGFTRMGHYRRTWQQEHMISHQIPLTLVKVKG